MQFCFKQILLTFAGTLLKKTWSETINAACIGNDLCFPSKNSRFHDIQSEFRKIIYHFFFTILMQVIHISMILILWCYHLLPTTTIFGDIYCPLLKKKSHREFSTFSNYRTNLIVRRLSSCLLSRNSLYLWCLLSFFRFPPSRRIVYSYVLKKLRSWSLVFLEK